LDELLGVAEGVPEAVSFKKAMEESRMTDGWAFQTAELQR